jgi:hypothetical protein
MEVGKRQKELFINYEYEFMDMMQFCDAEHLTRLVQAFCLFGFEDCPTIFTRFDKKIVDELNNLDEFNLTYIIRGLTRFKLRSGVGKNQTFVQLEPKIHQNFDNFDIRSLSHVMYAYGFREQGNPELHKKFLKRFKSHDELMDYHTMNNLIYYLMFTDNVDEELWTKVIQHTLQRNDHIPVTHFTPFKMSRYYIQHHFPEWDIRDYYDKFFYPERYYNASLKEKVFLSDQSKLEFTKYLANHFFLLPIDYVTFHN